MRLRSWETTVIAAVIAVVVVAGTAVSGFASGRTLTVRAKAADGSTKEIKTTVRIDTPQEIVYYQHGGILQFVLRQIIAEK